MSSISLNKILAVVDADDLEFDFYIDSHKLRNVHTLSIDHEDLSIEFDVDVDHRDERQIGGDYDEIILEYIEVSREITDMKIYNSIGDLVELEAKDIAKLRYNIDKRLKLKLY